MTQNIVSFSDATIKQSGKVILSDVSLDVPQGSFIFLIGRTGSGKSSLIRTIYGDLALAGGLGSVGDFDLTRLKSKDIPKLRRTLGVVFQDFKLLPDRSLLNDPKIIIADEPTGNLDPQTSQEIMQLFKSLHQKGMTVLMATHDYQMIVKFPGKIFKCEEGKVFEVVAKT
jgi:cell division transport system ATP-binding protein